MIALVTGGARGIGLAVCQAFAAEGYRVVIADMDGTTARVEAEALGEGHWGLPLDVSCEPAVAELVSLVEEAVGPISVLVNNAGIGDQSVATLEQSADQFSRLLDVHLRGTFLLSQACAEPMIARGRGAILNLSSIAAFAGIPGRNAYGAAKAGISAMTRSMACEWARLGVRVNAVAPGYVETALIKSLADKGTLDTCALRDRTPMGRLARADEIAQAVLFLASDRASYITGITLQVDGGWLALGAPEQVLSGTR
ncbi:SDR family oxidoreductase [Marinobacterium sp. D7]|uniref:SDR family NAD(P)-dependent oxidoreductase n=1 Tax=Marinobacterium ramblicola TaxID=2849041 RepID=UPI001C2D0E64|nr:glucose 1-dehydrogenase [Marinobacterium ramblicola]MBV1787592.1 SDR family oxidoreductase [Marinobacterium ramblicola]